VIKSFCCLGKKKKTGSVIKVFREDRRVLVSGVNIVARHQKPSVQNPEGGVLRREAPVHVSNVAHLDPVSGKPTRVGIKLLEDGQKVRYAKKSGELLDA